MKVPQNTIGMGYGTSKSLLLMSKRCTFSRRKNSLCSKRIRRDTENLMNTRMEKVKEEMEEIKKEQESIRKGQTEVKEKFEMIELECEELRKETIFMTQQSLNTQLRLCLMFQILKARQNNNFTKAAALTQTLREVIEKQSKQK